MQLKLRTKEEITKNQQRNGTIDGAQRLHMGAVTLLFPCCDVAQTSLSCIDTTVGFCFESHKNYLTLGLREYL